MQSAFDKGPTRIETSGPHLWDHEKTYYTCIPNETNSQKQNAKQRQNPAFDKGPARIETSGPHFWDNNIDLIYFL